MARHFAHKVLLQVKDLKKTYGSFNLAVDDFSLHEGQIVGLVGANGAGKSTLLKLILGITRPDTGFVTISGLSSTDPNSKIGIGYISELPFFSNCLYGRDIQTICKGLYGDLWSSNKFAFYMSKFELPVNQKISTFSLGMRAKLLIATTFSHSPNFLVLDEATNNLDPIIRFEINQMIIDFARQNNVAVLFASHLVDDLVKVCDKVVLMRHGQMILTTSQADLSEHYAFLRVPIGSQLPVSAVAKFQRENSVDYLVKRSSYGIRDDSMMPVSLDTLMFFYEKGQLL